MASVEPAKPETQGGMLSGFLAVLLTILALIPLGGIVFSMFGGYFFYAEMLVNFRVQLVAALLPFPFLMALTRRPYPTIFLFSATLILSYPLVAMYLPANRCEPGANKIRIMAFNVLASNKNYRSVVEEIRRSKADVVVITELTKTWETAFETLDDEYQWSVVQPRWHGYGLGVYSRIPITEQAAIQLSEDLTDNPAIDVVFQTTSGQFRLIAVHFTSPGAPIRLRMRNQQMEEAGKLAAESTLPTIIAGDFNCTPFSSRFSRLLRDGNLYDSSQGFGIQLSWPSTPWIIRIPIDHVLVSRDLFVHDRRLGNNCGSDHFPVTVDFSLASGDRAVRSEN